MRSIDSYSIHRKTNLFVGWGRSTKRHEYALWRAHADAGMTFTARLGKEMASA
jgi:hypothetical protein